MSYYLSLNKSKNIKKVLELIKLLNLNKTLHNKRTTMWENEEIQINIDNSLIRIFIFNPEKLTYYKDIIKQKRIWAWSRKKKKL